MSQRSSIITVCVIPALVTLSARLFPVELGGVVQTIFHLSNGCQETQNLFSIRITLTISTPFIAYFFFPFFSSHFLFSWCWVGSGISESQNVHFIESGNLNGFHMSSSKAWVYFYIIKPIKGFLAPGFSAQHEVMLAIRGTFSANHTDGHKLCPRNLVLVNLSCISSIVYWNVKWRNL